MRVPLGSTIATATVQLFFAASARAGAATFLATSSVTGSPYGFGICAKTVRDRQNDATDVKSAFSSDRKDTNTLRESGQAYRMRLSHATRISIAGVPLPFGTR